jgi:N-acetylmuramoyl-L-alanine amidase
LSPKRNFFVICLISLAALLLISGCGPQLSTQPYTFETNQYKYTPLNISTVDVNRYPTKRTVPNFTTSKSLKGKTIIVDAGHGGSDPGAGEHTLSPIPEKTINLSIAKELQIRLKAKGAKVIMTRASDTFVDLDVRAAMAERNKVHLLVSIHANSIKNRHINGTLVFVARNGSYKSNKVAQKIQASFINSNIKCRGIENQDFRVLAKHSRPAVLVEAGFMTNSYDVKNLNNSWYRKKLATAIANGIANAF